MERNGRGKGVYLVVEQAQEALLLRLDQLEHLLVVLIVGALVEDFAAKD